MTKHKVTREHADVTHRKFLDGVVEMLVTKQAEYAPDSDPLHNFRVSAAMTGENLQQALAGMMVKHTTSIYDMIRESSTREFSRAQWTEKIRDNVVYLLLLNLILEEVEGNSMDDFLSGGIDATQIISGRFESDEDRRRRQGEEALEALRQKLEECYESRKGSTSSSELSGR